MRIWMLCTDVDVQNRCTNAVALHERKGTAVCLHERSQTEVTTRKHSKQIKKQSEVITDCIVDFPC